MQQAAESSAAASSFASFLAALAAPPRPAGPECSPERSLECSLECSPDWNDDELADDIATLSYEPAQRTNGRHSPSDPLPEPGSESRPSRPERGASVPPDRSLKRASITIRLSEPECAQLRRRAAEAGLTVSAYLRSCAFEVETLRTQVKQTLAQLREPAPAPTAPFPSRQKPWFRFWLRRAADRP
jgi:hypothetical protein